MGAFTTRQCTHTGMLVRHSQVSLPALQQHLNAKSSHVLKFTSFLAKNIDAPFSVKKSVWNSVLQRAIFYNCETWLTRDLRIAETIYMSTMNQTFLTPTFKWKLAGGPGSPLRTELVSVELFKPKNMYC